MMVGVGVVGFNNGSFVLVGTYVRVVPDRNRHLPKHIHKMIEVYFHIILLILISMQADDIITLFLVDVKKIQSIEILSSIRT